MQSHRLKRHILASRLHRTLALVVGLQVLLWFLSGTVMTAIPIERVRGEHLVDRNAAAPLPPALTGRLLPAAAGATSLDYVSLAGRPAIRVTAADGNRFLADPETGAAFTLDAGLARAIAEQAHLGPLPAKEVVPITSASPAYRGPFPAWRISFDDGETTRVYVDPLGKVAGARTSTWRLYDFLWGLHIMDWWGRENINSFWLTAFAFGALLLSLAGVALLVIRWPRRRR
jgi:hypothetical protein